MALVPASSHPSGGSLPAAYTFDGNDSLHVTDENAAEFFRLVRVATGGNPNEVFSAFLRVYNNFRLDDCDMQATNDNGDVYFRLTAASTGTVAVNGENLTTALAALAALLSFVDTSGGDFDITLADGSSFQVSDGQIAATKLAMSRVEGGTTLLFDTPAGSGLQISYADGGGVAIGFFGASPTPPPELPAIPTPQNIADALVALGIVTQAA